MRRELTLVLLLLPALAGADELRTEFGGHTKLRALAQGFPPDSLYHDLAGDSAHPRRVQVGEVDELGAADRRRRGQVDVVADAHEIAGPKARIQASGGVGQNQVFDAELLHHADRESDRARRVALVEVKPALHDHHRSSGDRAEKQPTRVAFDCRHRKVGQVTEGIGGRDRDRCDALSQARAGEKAYERGSIQTGAQEVRRFRYLVSVIRHNSIFKRIG